VSVVAAIVGLALLVMIHEAGHFVVARAVGMTPRKFYLGFGPPLVRWVRGGVEYGIAAIPLGGYVKIPGMSRPSAGDLAASLRPDVREEHKAALARLDVAIEGGDDEAARAALEELRPALGSTRMWQELEMSLAPDAYWRQATWRRLAAIFAGPGVNLVFAIVIFTAVFMVATTRDTRVIAQVRPGTPAAQAHLRPGDQIVTIAGQPVQPKQIPAHIRATHGTPFRIVILRHKHRLTIGPLRARLDQGAYRIGIAIEARTGPGESLPAALGDSFRVTWQVTADTVRGIAHLVQGRDTNQVSSGVGIVRVSAAAWRQGVRDFLSVLGLISLALGLLNLLPLLPLDGGHIVIALVEKLRGRTFTQQVYMRYSMVGLGVMFIALYIGLRNDLFGGSG
jgi:regulator of sigma E protease